MVINRVGMKDVQTPCEVRVPVRTWVNSGWKSRYVCQKLNRRAGQLATRCYWVKDVEQPDSPRSSSSWPSRRSLVSSAASCPSTCPQVSSPHSPIQTEETRCVSTSVCVCVALKTWRPSRGTFPFFFFLLLQWLLCNIRDALVWLLQRRVSPNHHGNRRALLKTWSVVVSECSYYSLL